MRKSYVALLLCFLGIVQLCGCGKPALENIALPPDFMAQKTSIGVIWLSSDEETTTEAYRVGRSSLLQVVYYQFFYNNEKNDLYERLHDEPIMPFVKKYYLKVFSHAFADEGFKVQTVEMPYKRETLDPLEQEKQLQKGVIRRTYDLRSLAQELQVDYLVVLDISAFGVAVDKARLFLISKPKGYTALKCAIVDGASNDVIGQYYAVHTEVPQGEWLQPPDYPNLMEAVVLSFEKSLDGCFFQIFGRAP